MTQTLIGLDYEGVPCIKITKGDIDPGEEPDENVGSFLYNSKWPVNYRLAGIDLMPRKAVDTMEPPGSTAATYTKRTLPNSITSNNVFFRNEHFPDLQYGLPLFEVKFRDPANDRYTAVKFNEATHHWERRGGNWELIRQFFVGGWCQNFTVYQTVLTYGAWLQSVSFEGAAVDQPGRRVMVVWNLPGDDTPILDGEPQPPIEGANVIQIDSAGVRVAKPGFDLGNITRPSQLAIDTAHSPTKIIGAGDIEIPVGTTEYDIGFPIPPNAVADVFAYLGATIYIPANPISVFSDTINYFGVDYDFEGTKIRFYNPYRAVRVRFVIYALGSLEPTAGDNDVLRQFTENGENVVQVLRPGASEDPNYSDIVIDSRWPCLQVLKQGYLPVANGQLQHVVDFNGAGTFPIVKWMTVHGSQAGDYNWTKAVKPPHINICGTYKGGWSTVVGGDTTYCTLAQSKATFFTFRGNPIEVWYEDLAGFNGNVISRRFDPNPIIGIRYYILGIPAP